MLITERIKEFEDAIAKGMSVEAEAEAHKVIAYLKSRKWFDDVIRERYDSPLVNAFAKLDLSETQRAMVVEELSNWD